jgi:outer membrane lipoprotein carrier protein
MQASATASGRTARDALGAGLCTGAVIPYRPVEISMALQVTGVVLALATAAPPVAAADSGEALARRVDARQARVRDLTARFVQSYRSGVLGREVVERGTVSIKKPGLMRWEYRQPEKKLFVSDGAKFFFYVPADKQVIVKEQDGGNQGAAAILLGGGRILEHFQAFAEEPLPGRERLRLLPRKADPDVQRVYLEVDAESRVLAIEVWDAQGGHSRFQFDGVKENVGLKDDVFRFQPPSGVEVVTG